MQINFDDPNQAAACLLQGARQLSDLSTELAGCFNAPANEPARPLSDELLAKCLHGLLSSAIVTQLSLGGLLRAKAARVSVPGLVGINGQRIRG